MGIMPTRVCIKTHPLTRHAARDTGAPQEQHDQEDPSCEHLQGNGQLERDARFLERANAWAARVRGLTAHGQPDFLNYDILLIERTIKFKPRETTRAKCAVYQRVTFEFSE